MTIGRKKHIAVYIEGRMAVTVSSYSLGFLSIDKYCETVRMGSKRKENLFLLNTYSADLRGRIFNHQLS